MVATLLLVDLSIQELSHIHSNLATPLSLATALTLLASQQLCPDHTATQAIHHNPSLPTPNNLVATLGTPCR